MYEGVTEYFANLFKSIKLIDEEDYYSRLSDQIERSNYEWYNVVYYHECKCLEQPYKDQYINVYQKTLIGMCIDIIIREK
jgi:hypothetical protein